MAEPARSRARDSSASMTFAWNSAPGICPLPNGVVKVSFNPSALTPTTTIWSLNVAGLEVRRLSIEHLLLGQRQVLERVGRERRRVVRAHGRTAKRHERPKDRLRWAIEIWHHLLHPRHAKRAEPERDARGRDLVWGDALSLDGGRDGQ